MNCRMMPHQIQDDLWFGDDFLIDALACQQHLDVSSNAEEEEEIICSGRRRLLEEELIPRPLPRKPNCDTLFHCYSASNNSQMDVKYSSSSSHQSGFSLKKLGRGRAKRLQHYDEELRNSPGHKKAVESDQLLSKLDRSSVRFPSSFEKSESKLGKANGFGLPTTSVKMERKKKREQLFHDSDFPHLHSRVPASEKFVDDIKTEKETDSNLEDISASLLTGSNLSLDSASYSASNSELPQQQIEGDDGSSSNHNQLPGSEMNQPWTLTGDNIIQVDGLPQGCDLSNIEELISTFGCILSSEIQDLDFSKCSVRYKLKTPDTCDLAVSCLDNSDCIYTESNCNISCYRITV